MAVTAVAPDRNRGFETAAMELEDDIDLSGLLQLIAGSGEVGLLRVLAAKSQHPVEVVMELSAVL